MDNKKQFQKLDDVLKSSSIIHFPAHKLATFGTTVLNYMIVSPLDERTSRVREGRTIVERPAIITPQNLRRRFEGFGESAEQLGEWLLNTFGDTLRGLEYRFRNDLATVKVEHESADSALDRIKGVLKAENPPLVSLMKSPDEGWQLALLKFVLDMTVKSFRFNVQELDERGLFDPPEEMASRLKHREIRKLIDQAKTNPSLTKVLGEKLKAYGLFHEYEDIFFSLIRP